MRIALLLACLSALYGGEDPREIVLRSVALDRHNREMARQYTYLERSEQRQLDAEGRVKERKVKTFDVTLLEGSPYRRLVEIDDRPLSASDAAKEEEKLRKSIEDRRRETPEQRARRLADWDRRIRRQRESLAEVPEAFNLRILGQEPYEGRTAWVIEATPRPEYRGKTRIARFFPKMKGRLWIDTRDYQWVKVEAEVMDTISLGLFVARLGKGSHLSFEQARVNDEVWLPRSMHFRADGRLLLVKRFRLEADLTYSNYRKFQAESKIVTTEAKP